MWYVIERFLDLNMLFCNILDNIDTRSTLETLRELVFESNLYLRDRKPVNALLLHNIATYITKLLKIFGAINESTQIGFPVSTGSTTNVSCIHNLYLHSNKTNIFLDRRSSITLFKYISRI